MEELKPYWVMSPEYEEVIPILDDGTGPIESGRDCVGVLAFDKEHAKVLGVQAMRKSRNCKYIKDDPECSPFTGLQVELAICEHGIWYFTEAFSDGRVNNIQECNECYKKFDSGEL